MRLRSFASTSILVILAFFGGAVANNYAAESQSVPPNPVVQSSVTTSVATQTGTYGRATATVIFAINATMITTSGNFSIPDIPYPLPNGTVFQITRVETPTLFTVAPPNSCTITIRILEYTTTSRSSFFAYPMWITFNEHPCDSNGQTTYHLFHDSKAIETGTVKQTQP